MSDSAPESGEVFLKTETEKLLDTVRDCQLELASFMDRVTQMICVRHRLSINNVQALMLVGMRERGRVGEIVKYGAYIGSNVNYNLDKLENAGMVRRESANLDRRAHDVVITDAGKKVRKIFEAAVKSGLLTFPLQDWQRKAP